MTELAVHPVADLFPMLAEDELAELAADIKEHGLFQPIVLDDQGRVLDGRNRLAACKIAGIDPVFEHYAGDDPNGYAISVNVARRHMTQGQRAIVVARSNKLLERGSKTHTAKAYNVLPQRISAALLIEEVSPELSEQVLAGTKTFDAAHKEAQEMRQQRKLDEEKKQRLRTESPDLLALVEEERMSISAAIGALDAQQSDDQKKEIEQKQKNQEHAERVSGTLRRWIAYCNQGLVGQGLREQYARIYDEKLGDSPPFPVNADTIRIAGEALLDLADVWIEVRG